jgi:DNA-binding transcriptional LysR family regulator
MTLMQLKCFWTVGTAGSFSEAAEKLRISQSSVSKNIAALEQELMFPLFNRRGKTVVLSDGGRRMLEYCGESLEILKSMETEAEKTRRGFYSDNQIRLCGVSTMAAYGVISRINDFAAQNSDYEVAVAELDEDRVLLLLQSGGCDVAFCSSIKLSAENYDMLKVYREDFSVVFSKDHELAGKTELRLSDLKGQKLIFYKKESMLYDFCYNACVEAGFTPAVIARTSRPEIVMQYIGSHRCCYMGLTRGLGDIFSPGQCIKHIADSPGFDYVLCWKKSSNASPAVMSFINFFKRSVEKAGTQGA